MSWISHEGKAEKEREEETYCCLEGCCKDECFSASWDWSGSRVIHESEIGVSQTGSSCLAWCKVSPSWFILGSQFNQILSLLFQRTLKPEYKIPNQIKLCSSQFSQSITVSAVLCSLSLPRWEGNTSVSSYLCIWLLHVITVTHQTASLEISRIHNLYFGSTYFKLVILQTLTVSAKSNLFIFLCLLDSLLVVMMLWACSFTTITVWQLRHRHLTV